jgi:hypothetical protein
MWDAETGKELLKLEGGASGFCFSPDSKKVAGRVFSQERENLLRGVSKNSTLFKSSIWY